MTAVSLSASKTVFVPWIVIGKEYYNNISSRTMFHSKRYSRLSSTCNSQRRHYTISLLLATLFTIAAAAFLSRTWTSAVHEFLPIFRLSELSRSSTESVCPPPPPPSRLSSFPKDAPESLRKYITWHGVARNCLLTPSCENKPQLLIMRCTPGVQCGGLGDRFRAIEFLFLLSILSGRLFLIDWPAGPHSLVSLETVFHPASIDWRKPDHIDYDSSFELINWSFQSNASRLPLQTEKTEYFDLYSQNFSEKMEEFNNIAISSNAPHVFVINLLKNARLLGKYSDMGSESIEIPILLRALIQTLFKPTRLVRSVAEEAAFPQNIAYISVHARIGEDTLEADRPRFNKLVANMGPVASGLLDCAEKFGHDVAERIFLASDSTTFKNVFIKAAQVRGIRVKEMNGNVLHVGKHFDEAMTWAREEQCQSFVRVFADLYLLSQGEYIITTGSGFSKAAFHLGNPKNVMVGYSSSDGIVCKSERMGWE